MAEPELIHIFREGLEVDGEGQILAVCGVVTTEASAYHYDIAILKARRHGSTEIICQHCLLEILSVVLEDEG